MSKTTVVAVRLTNEQMERLDGAVLALLAGGSGCASRAEMMRCFLHHGIRALVPKYEQMSGQAAIQAALDDVAQQAAEDREVDPAAALLNAAAAVWDQRDELDGLLRAAIEERGWTFDKFYHQAAAWYHYLDGTGRLFEETEAQGA